MRPEAEEGPGEHGEAWETGEERLAAGHRQAPPTPRRNRLSSPHGASAALRKGLADGRDDGLGLQTADTTGMAMVEPTHDGLGSGSYSIVATGDRGGKASDTLVPGDKPLAR